MAKYPISLSFFLSFLLGWDVHAQSPEATKIYFEARRFELGQGCLVDEAKSRELYMRASDLGDARALGWKARRIFYGTDGFAKDEEGARKLLKDIEPLLREMILNGEPDAKGSLARSLMLLEAKTRGEEAFRLALEDAQGAGAAPCRTLGVFYQKGIGVAKDEKEAVKWWTKSAEQGVADGHRILGWCHYKGTGVGKDEKEAVKWYTKAVEQGDADGQRLLGRCYDNGIGVIKDEKEAVRWYTKAAEQGDATAQNNLGVCYDNGTGVAKDEKKAVKWYAKAAEQGNAKILNYLGRKLTTRSIRQFDANSADFYFKQLSGLPPRERGSADNFLIGMGSLETGDFFKAKQALLKAGNQYGPTAQNIQPESMRVTKPDDVWGDSVLQILDKEGDVIGTGVFCSGDGLVLTAAHVVAGQEGITARDRQMNVWRVEGLMPGEFTSDLVLMKTNGRPKTYAELADVDPKISDLVIQVGHPLGVLRQIVSSGKLENLNGDGGAWVCSLASMPGNSGSPVFNEDKELVGIASRASYFIQSEAVMNTPHAWVVPLDELKKLVQRVEDGADFLPLTVAQEWGARSRFWNVVEAKKAKRLLMGQTLLSGSYEDRDPQKAAAIFLTEAEKGDTQGIYLLGEMHYRGEGVGKDTEKAVELWDESAKQGNTQAMVRLGGEFERGGAVPKDRTKAFQWYQKAAEMGDSAAMANTGVYYLNGWGTERDLHKAAKWVRASAEKGNAFGQYVYGVMFEGGYGVKLSQGLAANWYGKAALGGNLDAMAKYGQCLDFGMGIKPNEVTAIVWYQKAAAGKNLEGIFWLGSAYANGRGVPKDFSRALKLWTESAKLGHQESKNKLDALSYRTTE